MMIVTTGHPEEDVAAILALMGEVADEARTGALIAHFKHGPPGSITDNAMALISLLAELATLDAPDPTLAAAAFSRLLKDTVAKMVAEERKH